MRPAGRTVPGRNPQDSRHLDRLLRICSPPRSRDDASPIQQSATCFVAEHDLTSEVQALREALWQMQKQVSAQQHEIEALKAQSGNPVTVPASSELLASRGNGVAGDSVPSTLESTIVSAGHGLP